MGVWNVSVRDVSVRDVGVRDVSVRDVSVRDVSAKNVRAPHFAYRVSPPASRCRCLRTAHDDDKSEW